MLIIERIANLENLYWAWDKVREFLRSSNIWFDQIEFSDFEAKLKSEIEFIQETLLSTSVVSHI